MRSLSSAIGIALGVLMLVGCPDPPPPKPPVPPAPVWIGGSLEPMVVDWDPDQRQSLEIAMRQGVAVVEYGDKGFHLLRDCKVDGKYGFSGAVRKEKVWHWDTADDIRANLPLGGLGLAAKLGGELQKGATLDVAIVMVGQLRTTWRVVTPKDLAGQCAGATHIVRGATIGAFAMDKGDKSHVRGALEIFKVGVSGGRASAESVRNVDGSFDECAGAKPDSPVAPGQCGALVKLELEALAKEAARDAAAPSIAAKDPCPPGFVEVEGSCAKKTTAVIGECTFGDAAGCEASCNAGRAKSCGKLGYMHLVGAGVPRAPARGAEALAMSCKGDVGDACAILGDVVAEGVPGVPKSPVDALKIYAKACDLGSADGCQRFGARVLTGMGVAKDPLLAARAMERACNGGNKDACSDLGLVFLGGSPPFRKDLSRAASLFKLACDGMSGVGCGNLGYMLEFGQGVQRDARLATLAYAKGCSIDDTQCLWFGALMLTGGIPGQAKDEQKAVELWKLACKAQSVPACAILKAYADPNIQLNMEIAQAYVNLWEGNCKENLARDCSALGVLLIAGGRPQDGEKILERGCKLGDPWGCDMAKRRHN